MSNLLKERSVVEEMTKEEILDEYEMVYAFAAARKDKIIDLERQLKDKQLELEKAEGKRQESLKIS